MTGSKPGSPKKNVQKKKASGQKRVSKIAVPPAPTTEKPQPRRAGPLTEERLADAGRSLERERNILQAVMNGAMNFHLVYLDRDFNFVRVNETYAATCGYRPEEMIGKNHFALYPNAENEAIFARVRDTGEPVVHHDKPFAFPDQPERGVTYWDWTLAPVKEANGRVAGLVFSLYETTGRKMTETILHEQELKARALINAADESILLFGLQGEILIANTTAARRLGMSVDEIVGKKWPGPLPSALAASRKLKLDEVVRTGNPVRFQDERAGMMFDNSLYPVRNEAGQLAALALFSRDITGQRWAEDALRKSEELFRTLTESSPDSIALHDRELRHLYVSPAIARMAGKPQQAFVGRTVREVGLAPAVADTLDTLLQRTLDTRRAVNGDLTVPLDSGPRYFLWRSVPMLEPDGSVRAIIAIASDITERKRTEEALKTAHEELKRRAYELEAVNRELEDFSFTVSHDLKTPLRSMEGFAAALLEDYADKLDETGMDYLTRVHSASERMIQLIDSLLHMARLTRGALREKTVDLSSLAQIASHNLRKQDPERGAKFIIAEKITASADQDMMMIVIQNLFDNAWKFTSKHPAATIEFGAVAMEGKTVYFVRDDGAGFDMQYAQKLFLPFIRLHKESEFPGLGIGLAVAHRIIMRHCGRLWAEAAVEKGATFFFTL